MTESSFYIPPMLHTWYVKMGLHRTHNFIKFKFQAAGVLPAESATVSGIPDASTPVGVADDGNSTQSASNLIRLSSGALLLVACLVMF
jgi:hypothetical protein